jgi:hypothetical protein
MAWSETRTQSERRFAAYFGLLVKYICRSELTTNLYERRVTEMNPKKTKQVTKLMELNEGSAENSRKLGLANFYPICLVNYLEKL